MALNSLTKIKVTAFVSPKDDRADSSLMQGKPRLNGEDSAASSSHLMMSSQGETQARRVVVRMLDAEPDNLRSTPRPTRWKGRTDSPKLSSYLCICTVACV